MECKCKYCGSQILYPTNDSELYLCSSDFEPDFPGWCHACLVEYCIHTDCTECKLKKFPDCSFISTKRFYLEEED